MRCGPWTVKLSWPGRKLRAINFRGELSAECLAEMSGVELFGEVSGGEISRVMSGANCLMGKLFCWGNCQGVPGDVWGGNVRISSLNYKSDAAPG